MVAPPGWETGAVEDLLERVRRLGRDRRVLLGICGVPGAGKSTFTHRLADALGPAAVVGPMAGLHLPDDQLRRL